MRIQLATQEDARFAVAQGEAYLEDCRLLQVLEESGLNRREAELVFRAEVN